MPALPLREQMLESCRTLMPGAFAAFGVEMVGKAFGDRQSAALHPTAALGDDFAGLTVNTDRKGNITVRRL